MNGLRFADDTNRTLAGEIASEYVGSGTLEEASHHLFKVSPEVNPVHLAYTLLSVFTVFFGMFSAFIKEKMYAGEAIIALCIGIGMGPYGADIFSPSAWANGHHADEITLEITRIVIALAVFAVGVELPRAYVWKHWRSLSILLGPTMLVGWLVSAAFIYLLVSPLNFLESLVVAACVTPTDPILAASVVGKGKFAQEHVPGHLRHILQAESGSNDGAAFPFLYFALFWLLRDHHTVGQAIGWWIVLVVLYQITLGCIIGAFVGVMARKLMKFSKYRSLIDRESMVAMYIALSLFVTGVTTLAGSDDLLAAFACGTAFAWDDWFSESIEDSNFSSILDLIVNCGIFFYVGATIPFAAWSDPVIGLSPWRLIVLNLAILLLRRIPCIFTLQKLIPDIRTMREALFVGHFGPIGIGALFISTLAQERLPTPNYPPETSLDILSLSIVPITYSLILSSVLVHGLSIPAFTNGRRLHKRVTSFSRTFTTQSARGEEPSWLSRVRRVGDPKPGDEEKAVYGKGDSPSSGSADAIGEKDKAAMDGGTHVPDKVSTQPEGEEEVWKEGSDIVREDPSGEHVRVEHASDEEDEEDGSQQGGMRGFVSKAKEIEAMITATERQRKLGKGRASDSDVEEDSASDSSSARSRPSRRGSVRSARSQRTVDSVGGSRSARRANASRSRSASPNPAAQPVKKGYWWTRDEESGLPRPLTQEEKQAAKRDKALRKEKHYCTQDSQVRWREGNRIIVEDANGEVVKVYDLDEDKSKRRSSSEQNDDLLGHFPNLHRLNTSEHLTMSDLLGRLTGAATSREKLEVHQTFSDIAGPAKDRDAKDRPSANTLAPPPAAHRPGAIRFNTAGIRQRFFGSKPQGDPSARASPASGSSRSETPSKIEAMALSKPPKEQPESASRPSPLPDFSKELTRNATRNSIRFDLPSDREVRRYDLEE